MHIFSKNNLKKWSAVALVPWLVACAGSSPFVPTGSTAANAFSEPTSDAVKPELKQITPQLLRAEKEKRDKQTAQDITKLMGKAKPYSIESGDILSIVVWDHPQLASGAGVAAAGVGGDTAPGATPAAGFVVDHEGIVQFPYAGSLKLAGLTEEQARNLLTSRLAKYINKPKVTLRVQSYRSKRIYIDGEVKAPGLQAINDITMTLPEAINRAGGFLPTADQSQIMITRDKTSYQVNMQQMVQRGINPNNIILASGDSVRVLSRDENKVFVSGEVVGPRALPMHNGRLTLNEALGESGGVHPLSGDARQIYVVRRTAKEPVVYQLDAHQPGALALAESFELNPKDVVYVAATPLANWHRTISMILPGALSSAIGAVAPIRP